MKRDFKMGIVLLAFSLPVIAALFIGIIYVANCGFSNNCARGDLAAIIHTPIPTLVPATLPAPGSPVTPTSAACTAPAETILAAWVSAGSPQGQTFDYIDASGLTCAATFTDIQGLFTRSNLWYPGALACTACHNAELASAADGLDLSSYSGILAGASGADILGGGNWDQSILNQVLFVQKQMPANAPPAELAANGPVIQAGALTVAAAITPTAAGGDEVPEPSNPGAPGPAVNLTGDPASGATIFAANCSTCHGDQGKGGVPNPGSTDGTVPALNPIDLLLKNTDPKIFATNIDLFIQHGSAPEGPNPFRVMPAWGDQNALTQQQIADVIAYLISLNP